MNKDCIDLISRIMSLRSSLDELKDSCCVLPSYKAYDFKCAISDFDNFLDYALKEYFYES